jgi:hypothetical protein
MSAEEAGGIAPVCPQCGSATVVPIVYGYPDDELMAAARAGRVALGGCVIDPLDEHDWAGRWRCHDCGER